jgi:transcription elongation GreA/GreB family factor
MCVVEKPVSRAFIKETDETSERLPEKPISAHPNLVTPEGLELIEATLGRMREERAAALAANDQGAQARIERELRYWAARHATAQVVRPPSDFAAVSFGCTVTIVRSDGRKQLYRIVGEDEADPARGTISYVSPLARTLMGKQVGDVVPLGNAHVEILQIQSLLMRPPACA